MTDVVITQSDRIEEAIAAALEHVPLAMLVSGRRVAVKPNETWASESDTTGITQPDTLRAVLRTVRNHGPRELVVTGGAGAAETKDVFEVGGPLDIGGRLTWRRNARGTPSSTDACKRRTGFHYFSRSRTAMIRLSSAEMSVLGN